jgi:NADPH2:quinone reductase
MKAIRVRQFGDPEVMVVEDVADLTPGAGQVLVRLHAAGVNPVETYIRSGNYPIKPPLPYTPGTDGAGIVEAVGSGVTSVLPGTRVFVGHTSGGTTGTYSQQAAIGASGVHPLPDGVSFAQGAALGVPYVTAWRALMERAQAKAGETVLVHGASGGVGVGAVQIARAAGLTVIGTAGTDRGRALVLEQGAHHVLDHGDAGYRDAIKQLTNGRGPDVIIEMAAHVNLQHDLTTIAQRGRLVIIGSRGDVQISPRLIMAQNVTVTGLTLWTATDEELRRAYAALTEGLANGTLKPVIGAELPLSDAPKAHRQVLEPGAHGKLVLIPS